MVCVPTSYTCTMCGGCLARYAATAALSVSAYEPLLIAFTTYSLCEALNLVVMSFTRSPSTAVIACQNWISVAAIAVTGKVARSTAETSTLRIERFMRASMFSRSSCEDHPCQVRRTIAHGMRRPDDAPANPGPRAILIYVRNRCERAT